MGGFMTKQVWMLCLGLAIILGLSGVLPESRTLPVYLRDSIVEPRTCIERHYNDFSFSQNPIPIFRTYNDYMIGSYNGNPLQLMPGNNGCSYMMTYHGSRQPAALRRVYHAYIENGSLLVNNEIMQTYNAEGFPSLAVDPVLGSPLYAFQGNYDTDNPLEVQFISDSLIGGNAGLFNSPQIIINNPISVTSNSTTTTDNVFLWPIVTTGPSPVAGHRRVYVLCTNGTGHSTYSTGNPLIAMADFDSNDIEDGTPLVWNYTTVPELNAWNIDPTTQRRTHLTILTDEAGNVYLCGYHETTYGDNQIPEIDIIKSGNYGAGNWIKNSFPTTVSSWNPPASIASNLGYFTDEFDVPYEDSELFWTLKNSSHFNAVLDSEGQIHIPGLWALANSDGGYYPALQFVKEFVVNPSNNQYQIKDISPQKNPNDTYNANMQPWDLEYPFGQVDYWMDENTFSIPGMYLAWNFPYHDATAHSGTMMDLYNNIKLSINQEHGLMAAVWQSCYEASWAGLRPREYIPEINIALSSDNGNSWSEPIVLNSLDNPQLIDMTPMWAYPANTIKYVGMQDDRKIGRLGLIFLDDYTWGAQAINPPVHPNNDGGQVMFTELEIIFPNSSVSTDPFGVPQGEPNMTLSTSVKVNSLPANAGDIMAAYTSVNGFETLRGKATLVYTGAADSTGCVISVSVPDNNQQIHFKLWNRQFNRVIDCDETIQGEINGSVGSWPDDLFLISFTAPVTVAAPTFNPQPGIYNSTVFVNLHSVSNGAVIRYTTDGTEPDLQSSIYTYPIHVSTNTTITFKAKAYLNDWVSDTTEAQYIVTGVLPTPSFSPTPGEYACSQRISIHCSNPQAEIHYTLNGEVPNHNSPVYENPIQLLEHTTTTIKARAYAQNWIDSYIASGTFIINGTLPALTFYPPSGTYSHAIVLTLSCAEPSVEIHYSLDGDVPTVDSPLYTGPLGIFQSSTISARAFKENWIPGPLMTAEYEIASSNDPDAQSPAFTGIHNLYPNPFRDTASIRIGIKDLEQDYSLTIYNIRGEQIHRQSGRGVGFLDLSWDGTDNSGRKVASGIYLLRFRSGETTQIRRLILN